jgi:hypothetical protein
MQSPLARGGFLFLHMHPLARVLQTTVSPRNEKVMHRIGADDGLYVYKGDCSTRETTKRLE